MKNKDLLRNLYGLTAYDAVPGLKEKLKTIKIAIIDNGFGPNARRERYLPASLFKFVPSYGTAGKPLDERDIHGRSMALTAWAMTGFDAVNAPQFHLLNGNGFTNLQKAIQYSIDNKIDIILYSQNWEYGGNFDGKGFINKEVSKATNAGILWVNAGGNYGGSVYNGQVLASRVPGWVSLGKGGGNGGLRVKSRLANNPVRIILSWNSYSEEETTGTDKDLDLYVYDEDGTTVLLKSDLEQIKNGPGVTRNEESQTFVPREIIEDELPKNTKEGYFTIRVYARKGQYELTDKLRITVVAKGKSFQDEDGKLADPIEFPDATKGGETMIPADHPKVIAVGDRLPTASVGPTTDSPGRAKPDLVCDRSDVEFDDGEGDAGTSNAAAMFTGILAMMKAQKPTLNRDDVMKYVRSTKPSELFRPGERQGIDDLGPDNVRKLHEPIFVTIETILRMQQGGQSPILLAGRYRNNGPYIVALDRTPFMLSSYYTHLPKMDRNPEHYEIYLATSYDQSGQPHVYAFYRDKMRPPGMQEGRWEQTLRRSPERFVQLVQAKPAQLPSGDDDKPFSRWVTPTPSTLGN